MKKILTLLLLFLCVSGYSQNFFFAMNKPKTLTPAYFDVTSITVPVGAQETVQSSCTIYITNTGTVSGSQDVNIKWKLGSSVKRDVDIRTTIGGNTSVNFTDNYTFELGEASTEWTIVVTTNDDSLTSSKFTVIE